MTGAAVLLLLHGAEWVPRAGWITRPVAALGRYSYGIYVWHVLAAELALGLLPGLDYASAGPVAQLTKFGAAIAVGVLATVLVERPVLRLRDRLVPSSSRPGAVAPVPLRPAPEPALQAA